MQKINGQDKRRIVDYFFEAVNAYKVTATTSLGDNKITLQVGGNQFQINTLRNNDISTRGVLTR